MASGKEPEQLHILQAMENLNRQRQDNQLCDVILKVEGKKFPAHRCVLASYSSYFKTMFTIEMKEKYQREVDLKNMDAASVERLLNFMYTSKVSIDDYNYYSLLEVASLTQTQGLLVEIGCFMETLLLPSNCLLLLNIADKYSLESVKNKADRCLLKNFSEVSRDSQFLELTETDLVRIFASNGLCVDSEEVVYEALVRWANHDLASRRETFPRLLRHVRLQYVSPGYLSETIRREALVRACLDCRDLVDDAFDFHLRPTKYVKQRQRMETSVLDSLMCVGAGPDEVLTTFDGVTKSWIQHTKSDAFISEGCAVASNGTRVFLCGGKDPLGRINRYVNSFDGQEWSYNEPNMISLRYNACAVCVNADLYVFGGETHITRRFLRQKQNNFEKSCPVFAEMLHSVDNNWKIVQNGTQELCRCAVAVVGENIYLLGGTIGQKYKRNASGALVENQDRASSNVQVFNTKTFSLSNGKHMNAPRTDFGAAALNNKIFVFGGLTSQISTNYSNVEFMDCSTNVWTNLATEPPISALGDISSSACWFAGQIAVLYSNHFELLLYDPTTNTWEKEELEEPLIDYKIAPIMGVS